MKTSRSLFVECRGLLHHVREWGDAGAPKLFLLHGWMDASASFQFLVDSLKRDWHVLAPDWRGFGLSQWSGADSYWIPDYLGDLDLLLKHYEPDAPVRLVGHSMGGNMACMYAGIRPARVSHLVNLEGLGLRSGTPQEAPERYARWMDQLATAPEFRSYADYADLARRIQSDNPGLSDERALFLAEHWGHEDAQGVRMRSDPSHKRANPIPYRLEEMKACWSRIQASVLWIEGNRSNIRERLGIEGVQERRDCFPQARIHLLDAGHMLHLDQPEQLAQLIEEFLP
ncbi:MAG TPA: alpha/beta hydrolase [Burkholderiales bacterium]|nr:alpha/beta hydrolase [Burkholderiales bacterium]